MAERKSRQLTPAKFGPDVTSVSQPNLNSASHVEKGVVNEKDKFGEADSINRLAKGIKGGLEFGIDLHDAVRKGQIKNKQEETIQEFVDSRDQPVSEELQEEIGFQDQADEFSGFNNDTAVAANTTQVAANHNRVLQKLSSAKKQGIMGADEFNTRILTNLREAVNRNPNLAPELIAISKRTLELSGVQSIIDTEADSAKASAKAELSRDKHLMSIAKENDIPVPFNHDSTVNREALEPILAMVQKDEFDLKRLGNLLATGQKSDQLEARKLIQSNKFGVGAMNGALRLGFQSAQEVLDDKQDGLNIDQKIETIRKNFATMSENLADSAGALAGDPAIEKQLLYFNNRAEDFIEGITGRETLVASQLQAKNIRQIYQDEDFVNVHKNMRLTPEQGKILQNYITAMGPALFDDEEGAGIKLKGEIINMLSRWLLNTSAGGGASTDTQLEVGGENVSVKTLQSAVQIGASGKKGGKEALGNGLSRLQTELDDPKSFKAPVDKYKYVGQVIEGWSQADLSEDLGKVDTASAGKMLSLVQGYTKTTVQDFTLDLKAAKFSDPTLKIGLFPDGRLTFTSTKNPAQATEMTKRYGVRISQAARVSLALSGGANRESLEAFYSSFPPLREALADGGIKMFQDTGAQNEVRGKIRDADPVEPKKKEVTDDTKPTATNSLARDLEFDHARGKLLTDNKETAETALKLEKRHLDAGKAETSEERSEVAEFAKKAATTRKEIEKAIPESKQIRSDEGGKQNAKGNHIVYRDSAKTKEFPNGHLTAGIGHFLTKEEQKTYGKTGIEVPQYLVDSWYAKDLVDAKDHVEKLFGKQSNPEVDSILTNMAFNMGKRSLRGFEKMTEALKESPRDYDKIADEMEDSKWFRKDVPERAKRLVKRMRALKE